MNFESTEDRNGAVYTATAENNLVLQIRLIKHGEMYKQETYLAGPSGGIFISFIPKKITEDEFKKLAINVY